MTPTITPEAIASDTILAQLRANEQLTRTEAPTAQAHLSALARKNAR